MSEKMGIEYLRKQLNLKRGRVCTRYQYYEMKNKVDDFNISTPPNLRWRNAVLGWCAKSVDSLADRLVFRGFKDDNFNFNSIFQMNNPDIFADSAVLSALIAACSFIYISKDETGFPRLQVIDGGNATGRINPITGLLFEGYAVLERNENGVPVIEAYFDENETVVIYEDGEDHYTNPTGIPLLVPMIYRPDAMRPFGHSRISRACMDIAQAAARTLKRSEISAEFYSFPQKYVTGLSDDAEQLDTWRAAMSTMMMFTKDDEGDKPTVGQFSQQSMEPHISQLRAMASLFAGETGLTLDDLGFATENPSSSEAIKAGHESLRLTARKAQRTFGSALLNVGYVAACLRDDVQYLRRQIYLTQPLWEPLFEPDAANLSAIGDGVIKINQAVPGYIDSDNLRDLTGID